MRCTSTAWAAGTHPAGPFADAIARDFGGIDRWRTQLSAMGQAEGGGSGWVILSYSLRDKRLVNQWAADHTTTPCREPAGSCARHARPITWTTAGRLSRLQETPPTARSLLIEEAQRSSAQQLGLPRCQQTHCSMRSPKLMGRRRLLALTPLCPIAARGHYTTSEYISSFQYNEHIIGRDYDIPSRKKANHILLRHRSDVIRSVGNVSDTPRANEAGG
jgi:Iron/manganese superoxide dismutases, C-terminal domain